MLSLIGWGHRVTSKVVSLLDAFLPAARELSLNELAARTGLPPSSTYRLASQLVAWGGLERGDVGGYRIGLRLWEIGALRAGRLPLHATGVGKVLLAHAPAEFVDHGDPITRVGAQ